MKLSGNECNGVVVHTFLQAKRKLRVKAKTSITCFMTTTTTTTTQVHLHKKENRIAAIKNLPEKTQHFKNKCGLQPIKKHSTSFSTCSICGMLWITTADRVDWSVSVY